MVSKRQREALVVVAAIPLTCAATLKSAAGNVRNGVIASRRRRARDTIIPFIAATAARADTGDVARGDVLAALAHFYCALARVARRPAEATARGARLAAACAPARAPAHRKANYCGIKLSQLAHEKLVRRALPLADYSATVRRGVLA